MIEEFIHQIEPFLTRSERKAVWEYLSNNGWLTEYEKTREFEDKIAEFLGVKYAVACTSGTVGLYLALLAVGINKNSCVAVPNFTMIATPNAVKWIGADLCLVDISPFNLCMNPLWINEISDLDAIIYVPINGRAGQIDEIVDICKSRGIILIEDACQAFGSRHRERFLGTFGKVGVFSFTPHKIITTGQGGVVVTDDEDINKKLRKLKDFGRTAPGIDIHDQFGFNFKFTDLQAVIGLEQIKTIEGRMEQKKRIYDTYGVFLKDVTEMNRFRNEEIPWFVDVILPSKRIRDGLQNFLRNRGIGTRPFYPPINHQEVYSGSYDHCKTLSISEDLAYRGLWLPSSLSLTEETIKKICEMVKLYLENVQ